MAEWREQRLQLVALIDAGFSATEAGRRLGIPRTTTQGWARRYRNFGEVGRRPGSGRPRVSTREQDEALGRAVLEDSSHSARDLKAASGFPGCPRTVTNRLRTDYNIRHYRAESKISMTEGQAIDRLASVTGCFSVSIEGELSSLTRPPFQPITMADLAFIENEAPCLTGNISINIAGLGGFPSQSGAGVLVMGQA